MKNIGPKSAAWLAHVGVAGLADLRRIGPVEVYLQVEAAGFKPGLNLLWALAGAMHDCHWTRLPVGEREALLMALECARDELQRR